GVATAFARPLMFWTSGPEKKALHVSTRLYLPVLTGASTASDVGSASCWTSSPEGMKSLAMSSRAEHPDSRSAQETSAAAPQFLLVLTMYFPHVNRFTGSAVRRTRGESSGTAPWEGQSSWSVPCAPADPERATTRAVRVVCGQRPASGAGPSSGLSCGASYRASCPASRGAGADGCADGSGSAERST